MPEISGSELSAIIVSIMSLGVAIVACLRKRSRCRATLGDMVEEEVERVDQRMAERIKGKDVSELVDILVAAVETPPSQRRELPKNLTAVSNV